MTSPLHGSVARVLGKGDRVVGTGVVLSGGWLLTCAHVVAAALTGDKTRYSETAPEGDVRFDVANGSGRVPLEATLEDCLWGPAREGAPRGVGDHALLRITSPDTPEGLLPCRCQVRELGDTGLWAYGFPAEETQMGDEANLELSANPFGRRDGLIAIYRDKRRADGFIRPGFSGGPVFARGQGLQLLGMVKGVVSDKEAGVEQAFILPGEVIAIAYGNLQRSAHRRWYTDRERRRQQSVADANAALAGADEDEILDVLAGTETPSADGASENPPRPAPVSLDHARMQDTAARLADAKGRPAPDLADALARFVDEVTRKRDRLPQPYNQGYFSRRAERLQRDAGRLHVLHPDRLGEYAFDLLSLSAALDTVADPDDAQDFEPLASAVAGLTAALDPARASVLGARDMPGDGAWPSGMRLRVREAAAEVASELEPLHRDPDAAPLAANLEAGVNYIEDQTWLDRPNWAVMARNALEAGRRISEAASGPFGDLGAICRELRQAVVGAQHRMIAALPDGAAFRELPDAPEMVVVPACPGGFLMGTPEGQAGRFDEEAQHRVRIPQRFALGRYAASFAEYDAFCEATGRDKPGDEGWGRGRRPAIHVSWHDAVACLAWLSERTGAEYRLPSEAEWEYACRGDATGGNETPFCPQVARAGQGAFITAGEANFRGTDTFNGSPEGEDRQRTVPVDHHEFRPNGFGLWQMHGNVWEWCADVFEEDYARTPDDGSAHLPEPGPEGQRVLRGGSWNFNPGGLRSAFRNWNEPENRDDNRGFRPARTLFTP